MKIGEYVSYGYRCDSSYLLMTCLSKIKTTGTIIAAANTIIMANTRITINNVLDFLFWFVSEPSDTSYTSVRSVVIFTTDSSFDVKP